MTAIKENLCFKLKTIKGCSIPVCTMQLQLMLLVLDWQTDTNTSTAFNYLELKQFQSRWHIYHPTRSYREDATLFCFQHKFLEVCADVTCLQCVICLVIWFFVGISFVRVFTLPRHHHHYHHPMSQSLNYFSFKFYRNYKTLFKNSHHKKITEYNKDFYTLHLPGIFFDCICVHVLFYLALLNFSLAKHVCVIELLKCAAFQLCNGIIQWNKPAICIFANIIDDFSSSLCKKWISLSEVLRSR